MVKAVAAVILVEEGKQALHLCLLPLILRESPLAELDSSVADEHFIRLDRMCGIAQLLKPRIHRLCQVPQGIGKGAVKVKYRKSVHLLSVLHFRFQQ